MAWTTPRTWVTSEVVTASTMNSAVRDNLTFLRNTDAVAPVTVTANSAATSATTELVLATLGSYTADGSTEIELAFSWYFFACTVANDQFIIRLYDGATAGSGTLLNSFLGVATSTGAVITGGTQRHRYTPAAGAHVYTARIVRNSGTGTATLNAAATTPAILTATRTA